MAKYFLTDYEFTSTPPARTGAPLRAELAVEPHGEGCFIAHWVAPGEEPGAADVEIVVSESRIARLAATFPACLLEKLKVDYELPDVDFPHLLTLYIFQAAVCALGLKLIIARQLVDDEMAGKITAARSLEESLPWVALLLQREGVPEMRWWEEQTENFLDLWYSSFRLHVWAAEEHVLSCPRVPEEEIPQPSVASRGTAVEDSTTSRESTLAARVATLERDLGTLKEWMGLSTANVKEVSPTEELQFSHEKSAQ